MDGTTESAKSSTPKPRTVAPVGCKKPVVNLLLTCFFTRAATGVFNPKNPTYKIERKQGLAGGLSRGHADHCAVAILADGLPPGLPESPTTKGVVGTLADGLIHGLAHGHADGLARCRAFMTLANVFAVSNWDSSASGVARDRKISSRVHEHGVRASRRRPISASKRVSSKVTVSSGFGLPAHVR